MKNGRWKNKETCRKFDYFSDRVINWGYRVEQHPAGEAKQ